MLFYLTRIGPKSTSGHQAASTLKMEAAGSSETPHSGTTYKLPPDTEL
jgi:hypothetical protein